MEDLIFQIMSSMQMQVTLIFAVLL